MAFEVPEIATVVAGLQADGIETGDVIDCSSILAGMSVCFFQDPEGNVIELMEGFKDDPACAD